MSETSERDSAISIAARAIAEGRNQPFMVHSSALAQYAISALEAAGFAITRIDGDSVIVPREPNMVQLFEMCSALYRRLPIGEYVQTEDVRAIYAAALAAAERNEETG